MYFTVCIPTYNRKYILGKALYSLERQSFKDFEVLIIDDGSIDNTSDFVDDYKQNSKLNIKYYFKQNGGKHTALNLGIEKAIGKYFVILDSDDELEEHCLEFFFEKSLDIDGNNEICGIIARCADIKTKKLIGKKFPKEGYITSYIDIHWGSGLSLFHTGYSDCLEAIKLGVLKQYRWPEKINSKFIPEDYVTDQIGLKYFLVGYNKVIKVNEYFNDGITKNQEDYKKKNIDGYLEKYLWNVAVLSKERVSFIAAFRIWYQYFYGLQLRKKSVGYIDDKYIVKIPLVWKILMIFLPVLNLLKNKIRKLN